MNNMDNDMARISIPEPLEFHSMAFGKSGSTTRFDSMAGRRWGLAARILNFSVLYERGGRTSTSWQTEGGDSSHVSSIPRFYMTGVGAPDRDLGVLFLGSERRRDIGIHSTTQVIPGHGFSSR